MSDVRIKYDVNKSELVSARKELDKINKELGVTKKQGDGASKAIKGIGAAVVAAFTVDKLIDFGKKVVSITAEFQALKAVLTNTLGSKSAADAAFTRIQEFASQTPFQVTQLTASFVKLANQGFVPTNEELRKLGDLASSTGKDFDQLTEAIIDAQVGEFERLKEFGIRASKQGDEVTFAFKGVETQVDFTSDSIREYLVSLGDVEGVSGSMAAVSATLGGQISNLQDSFDSLFFAIGQATGGIISDAITALNILVNRATELINLANGVSTKAADEFNKLNEEFANLETVEDYAEAIKTVKDRINSLSESTGDAVVDATKQSASLLDLEKNLEGVSDAAGMTVADFEKATQSVVDTGIQVNVLNDFLKQLESGMSKLDDQTDETDAKLTKLSETFQLSLISVIREAQQELNAMGGQTDATLEDIENFILQEAALLDEQEAKDAERRQKGLDDFNAVEQQKRQIAFETAQTRLDIEQTVVSGTAGLLGELRRTFGESAKAFIIFEKALSIAEVIINLQKELAAIAFYASANPANIPTGGAAGAAIYATQASLAKARAGFRIATIGAQTIGELAFKDGVIDLQGPGTETSDSIPALLSRRESVMTADETKRFLPTLKAIRENRVSPELLNSVVIGKAPQVINNLTEVPRDTFMWDENGFSHYMHRKNITIQRKNIRYKC